jgi:hypothetical protein
MYVGAVHGSPSCDFTSPNKNANYTELHGIYLALSGKFIILMAARKVYNF